MPHEDDFKVALAPDDIESGVNVGKILVERTDFKWFLAGKDAPAVFPEIKGIEIVAVRYELPSHFCLKKIIVETVEVEDRPTLALGSEQPHNGASHGSAIIVGLADIMHLKAIAKSVLMPTLRQDRKSWRKA